MGIKHAVCSEQLLTNKYCALVKYPPSMHLKTDKLNFQVHRGGRLQSAAGFNNGDGGACSGDPRK